MKELPVPIDKEKKTGFHAMWSANIFDISSSETWLINTKNKSSLSSILSNRERLIRPVSEHTCLEKIF